MLDPKDPSATDAHPTVLHIPHASRAVPREESDDILLADADLERELTWMTDAYTDELFQPVDRTSAVVFPVSRFVVDPERFEDDSAEPMAARGMGVIYTRTSHGLPLRATPSAQRRAALLARYYRPHHDALTRHVEAACDRWGRCVVIDCHSFPSKPLPYEPDRSPDRPDICLGTDDFHTPEWLVAGYEASFRRAGLTVARNRPFAGALVPSSHFRRDRRVAALMIEVNRKLYMDEESGARAPQFEGLALCLRRIIEERIGADRGVGDDR